jgi:hypothetical protein
MPLLASSLSGGALAAPAPQRITPTDRLIAFGDVHGAYDDLLSVLDAAGVVDAERRWAAGDAIVVSVGDLLDRGPSSRQVLDLLMRLQTEAAAAGGQLALVVGNHEVMNLMGDLRYVSGGEFAAFAADETPELRARMLAQFAALPENAGQPQAAIATRFEERFPPGWFAHREAFSPQGKYGRWLLERPALLVVGDTVFAHGGLPATVAELGLEGFNDAYRRELTAYFDAFQALEQAGIVTAFDDGNDALSKAKAWLDVPESANSPLRATAETLLAADRSRVLGLDSVFWYRATVLCHAPLERPTTEAALQRLGVKRVVVGHTPTPRGLMFERFDGQVVRVDTGMNRAVYGGHPSALVMQPSGLAAVYAESGIDAGIQPLQTYAGAERIGLAEARVLDAMAAATLGDREPAGPDSVGVVVALDGVDVPAVFRWLDERDAKRELAAYRLDRVLGLGLVPPTVMRDLDGRGGVLQLRPGDIESLAQLQAAGQPVRANWCPVPPQYQLLYAFDTLLLNERRTPDSILYDTDQWIVMASAHEGSFGSGKRLPRQLANTTLEPIPGLTDRLDRLTEDELEQALGDLLSKREIKGILERARLLPRTAAAGAAAGR